MLGCLPACFVLLCWSMLCVLAPGLYSQQEDNRLRDFIMRLMSAQTATRGKATISFFVSASSATPHFVVFLCVAPVSGGTIFASVMHQLAAILLTNSHRVVIFPQRLPTLSCCACSCAPRSAPFLLSTPAELPVIRSPGRLSSIGFQARLTAVTTT